MKIILIICVMCASGYVGFMLRQKLKIEHKMASFLLDFEKFYNSNMTLFKNDVVAIIDGFVASRNKKNGENFEIFEKTNNIYNFNTALLEKCFKSKTAVAVSSEYLNSLGKNEYEFEKEKNKNFEEFISKVCDESLKSYEKKGSMIFKLCLAIGAVLSIIIW